MSNNSIVCFIYRIKKQPIRDLEEGVYFILFSFVFVSFHLSIVCFISFLFFSFSFYFGFSILGLFIFHF